VFSRAKQKAFYGKWTESFYSYDASLYDEYTAKSSLSHVDRSALAHSSEIHQQEPSVSSCVFSRRSHFLKSRIYLNRAMYSVQMNCVLESKVNYVPYSPSVPQFL